MSGAMKGFCRRALAGLTLCVSHFAFCAVTRPFPMLGLSGTIGDLPVVMIVTPADDTHLRDVHYSYVSQHREIPLKAKAQGETFIFVEPGGGVFDLRFVTSRPDPGPVNWRNAAGLQGTWMKGARHLPVVLHIEIVRDGLRDCALYPEAKPVMGVGPHFPGQGCEELPDRRRLDACIGQPYSSDSEVVACVDGAMRPCRSDQKNANGCTGNVASYLEQVIDVRLSSDGRTRFDERAYGRWRERAVSSCKATTDFGVDGTGYGADIMRCMATEELRLLQNGLRPLPQPIRTHPPRH
ncbi:hypothetical protein AD929_07065 [Gluconobacter potus]|uniref:Uncharacterized protein n=1 Tax=Gluconobacter potus TaxID=2724927 RepID=A0A149QVB8_9PROT|nr:hypothetical protein [Gluconobacter potus]KXV01240.1 hypothetical protein AD929_07065 [Gluconobacter potus]